jgi:hypothetical protein
VTPNTPALRARRPSALFTALVVAGVALVVIGVGLVFVPAALILAGLATGAIGWVGLGLGGTHR